MNQNGPLIFMCTVPQLDNIEKQVALKKSFIYRQWWYHQANLYIEPSTLPSVKQMILD